MPCPAARPRTGLIGDYPLPPGDLITHYAPFLANEERLQFSSWTERRF